MLAALTALVLAVAGCGGGGGGDEPGEATPEPSGGDGSTTTTAAQANNVVACRALDRVHRVESDVRRLSLRAASEITRARIDEAAAQAEFRAIGDEIEANAAELEAALDDAVPAAPTTIAGDVQALADALGLLTPLRITALQSGSLAQIAALLADPEVVAAAASADAAIDALNRYTVAACGFRMSD